MDKHPIENIMRTTMESIRDMIDVNTIVGDAVEAGDGTMIIPISRVSFGFIAGGGEYRVGGEDKRDKLTLTEKEELPFAGGTGAGVTVNPMGFLVVGNGQVRMLSAQYNTPLDRIIEMVPQIICDVKEMCEEDARQEKERKSKEEREGAGGDTVPPAQPTKIVPPEPMSPHMYPDAGHIDDSSAGNQLY